ncbi:RNRI protein [Vibrio phage YC]|uniref:Ribonucleoside-diphosphate reductase n=1 Tax=Vibrio phage YC TaxID=2267403 RepID=A0A384ZSD9_9CAUD|nr:ribonucleotide reductase large subunit [Vibrio phage YC]AXC34560.1 RNRI protein [Vibrio phage YC]
MQGIRIRKRDGRLEPLNVDKVHRVVEMMVDGLEDVNLSEVEIGAQLQFTDGMTSERIQELIIRSAEDLISPDAPNYQYVASRGQLYDVRKRAFGNEIPSYSEHVNNMIKAGYYDPMLLDDYSAAELVQFDAAIDHRRDNNFGYAACGQLLDKYLIRDRTKHRAFKETPQMMYMAIACSLLSYLPSHNGYRVKQIIKFYNAASTFDFSLPTPIMAGARTPTRQFSSCVLIKCGDTLPSINATALAITNYVSKRAGIGWDIGEIRAEGSPIRNGEMTHTGLLPFLKYHVGALKSCSQGGIRGGSGTVYYPWWHYQFDDLIVLKNNRGIEENRERRADYGVQLNGFLLGKYLRDEDVYLFDPKDCPDMYSAFFADQEKFALLYEDMVRSAERGEVRFKKFTAKELLNDMLLGERTETGRIYIAFVDNMNSHSPFDPKTDPIYQSNLCFTGDTMVATADGTNMVSIADLANRQQDGMAYKVYSARPNKSRNQNRSQWVDEIKDAVAVKTRVKAPIVKVMLSTGDTFRCTPNHLLAKPNGEYVTAEHAVGETLQGFFTSMAENKYRTINSVKNAHKKQHRMIWEHHNGKPEKGVHVDHIEDDGGDFLENLQLMDAKDNYAKKSDSMKGDKNPVHGFKDDPEFLAKCSANSTGSNNPRFGGMTSEEMVVLGIKCKEIHGGVSLAKMREMDERTPTSLSKNRFGGKMANLHKCIDAGELLPEFSMEEVDKSQPKSPYSLEAKPENPTVVAVVPDGFEDVYDLHVQDNHNFNIITNNDPLNSRGVLVHNCLEIALPTREFQHEFDEDGRIALCTLASFNMSKFIGDDAFERMQDTAELIVQALDGLLRMQDYPMVQAKIATDEFRTLGVGIVNLADFFMQQGLQYGSDEALEVLNKWMEKFNYSLTRASVNLAKQDGPCEAVDRTCYAKGIFPWELYAPRDPQVELGASTEMMQLWADLRSDVRKYGIRNATLSAIAPTESSSQVLNATNGVEMPKAPMSIKASKSGNFKQIVPDSSKMANYQYLWKQPSPEAYLRTCAVAQKWVDQSISTNTFYNPMMTGDEIQRDKAMRHIIAFHAMGGKTLYYSNVYDGAGDEIDEVDMAKFCAGCVV